MRKSRTLAAIIYHQRNAAHHATYARFYRDCVRILINSPKWFDRAVYHQQQAAAQSSIARRLMDSVC